MGNNKYISPQNLDDAITNEILGGDFCVLFAIAKNGEVVRYHPSGTPLPPKNTSLPDSETVCFEISFCVPKCYLDDNYVKSLDEPQNLCDPQTLAEINSTSEGIQTLLMVRRTTARKPCCKAGGKEVPC
jgi:hypothetical protein